VVAIAADVKYTIISFDEVTSTNDVAREHAKGGCPEGLVITAARQTKGRGRRGRSWHSESGGLYFSILLKPNLPSARVSLITLAAGAAVVEVLREQYQLPAELKWPNDVVVFDRKTAGVLCEGFHHPGGSSIIVGIGVNTNQPIASLPEPLQAAAGSVRALTGLEVDNDFLLKQILARFKHHYHSLHADGGRSVLESARQYTAMLGKEVTVITETEIYTAIACGLSDQGALVVEKSDGSQEELWAADVSIQTKKGED
jgi:BirA family biotin operon repressor/biotin-[acetyl-CoA-carboxylase] ligase